MMRITRFIILLLVFAAAENNIFAADVTPAPVQQNAFGRLTTHRELMDYVQDLAGTHSNIDLKIIGHSVQKREIPALFFSSQGKFGADPRSKPVILIYCQQHGNEPSGKEAALMLAGWMAGNGAGLLDKLDIILVPQVNPDGSEAGRRRNANGMDLNRNHVILSEPESQALHNLFLDWMPQVTLDIHEYNALKKKWIEHGFVKDAAEMLGACTNKNIDPQLIRFSLEEVLPGIGTRVKKAGFTFHRYIVGSVFGGERIRYSTVNVNDGRQSMGIYNTLSFIIEGKRYGPVDNEIERRVRGQLAALKAFLDVMADKAAGVVKLVADARARIADFDRCYLQMDYFPDSTQKFLNYPVFDFNSWKAQLRPLSPFEPKLCIKKSLPAPQGYLISKGQARLLKLLGRHRIKMVQNPKQKHLVVEVGRIMHVTAMWEEDKPAENVDVQFLRREMNIDDKYVLVPLQQPAARLLPLLLEAQSTIGVCSERSGRKYRFKEFLEAGSDFPVMRVIKGL